MAHLIAIYLLHSMSCNGQVEVVVTAVSWWLERLYVHYAYAI